MITQKLTHVANTVRIFADRHSPEILTGIGVAGMITTTVLAVRATPKALSIIEEHLIEKEGSRDVLPEIHQLPRILPIKDVLKLTWKCYIPTVVTGALSITCIIGANSVNTRRNAALATAYKISETALTEYKAKVIDTIGEKEERAIRDKIAKDQVDNTPVSKSEVFITEKGNTLCFDAISSRYFKTDIDKIRRAEHEINKRLRNEMYVSLNQFYYEIGLSGSSMGDQLGWNVDKGWVDIWFSSQLAEDDSPCLVINYSVSPKYGYDKLL